MTYNEIYKKNSFENIKLIINFLLCSQFLKKSLSMVVRSNMKPKFNNWFCPKEHTKKQLVQ
jgi:hypothetical protein